MVRPRNVVAHSLGTFPCAMGVRAFVHTVYSRAKGGIIGLAWSGSSGAFPCALGFDSRAMWGSLRSVSRAHWSAQMQPNDSLEWTKGLTSL